MARGVPRGFDAAAFTAARMAKGWNLPELARRSRVGLSTMIGWERRGVLPQLDKLRMALEAMGVSAFDVINVPPDERTIADWRALRLLLQPELGKRAGIGTPLVSYLETGTAALSSATAEKLAAALEISIEEVWAAAERSRELGV